MTTMSSQPNDLRVLRESQLSLVDEAAALRRAIVKALHQCGSGHYGGALSVVDILLTLYRRTLRIAPGQPRHPERDRLILSKGHAAIALYATLKHLGLIEHDLAGYATMSSTLEGHPDMLSVPAVDFSTGSLGQGLSVGLGMALAMRDRDCHVWVVLGDGECQEGQVWEAAMLAAQCELSNLHAVVDHNHFQEWGWRRREGGAVPPPVANLGEKFGKFGWTVLHADGHCFDELEACLTTAAESTGAPSVVIADTVKGKGYPLIESDPMRFHCGELTDTEHQALLRAPEEAA